MSLFLFILLKENKNELSKAGPKNIDIAHKSRETELNHRQIHRFTHTREKQMKRFCQRKRQRRARNCAFACFLFLGATRAIMASIVIIGYI